MHPHLRRLVLLFALSLTAAAALGQTHQFAPEPFRPWHYYLPGTISAFAAGNIDADSDLEVIAAHEIASPDSIEISLHDPLPGGGFTVTQIANLPHNSFVPTTIDFEWIDLEGDGDLDLLIGINDPSGPHATQLRFYENDGAGNLTEILTIDLLNAIEVTYDADDYDGDGDIDVVIASRLFTTQITPMDLYEQVSPLNFVLQPTALPGTLASDPEFADVDGDGDQDIAAIGGFSKLLLFTNDNGVFSDVEIGTESSFVIGEDLDGDGDDDLMVQRRDSSIDVLIASGGTFTSSTALTRYTLPYQRPEFADLDGDNDLDAAVYADNQLVVLRNDGLASFVAEPVGQCSFAEPADIDHDGTLDLLMLVPEGITPAYSRPTGMAHDPGLVHRSNQSLSGGFFADTADFDSDAAIDLLYVTNTDVHIHQNLSCGEWRVHTMRPRIRNFRPRAADIDGDGDDDIVMLSTASSPGLVGLEVLRNDGDFTFVPLPPQSFAPGNILGKGDLDGDGRTDLLLRVGGFSQGSLRVLNGTASGVFAPATTISSGNGSYIGSQIVDFDGDQDLDILFTVGANACVPLLENDGNGNFSVNNPCAFQQPYPGYGYLTYVDIDGDGDIDVFAEKTGEAQLLLNDNGSFTTGQVFTPSWNGLDTPLFADWDGDGDMDLLHAGGSNEDLWLQDNGVFSNESSVRQLPGAVATIGGIDLDGDGDIDRINSGTPSELLMINHQRSARSLQVPLIGGEMRVQFAHEPGYATTPAICVPVVSFARSATPMQMAGMEGLLQIDVMQSSLLPYLVFVAPNYTQVATLIIPPTASLLAIDLYAQGLMITDKLAFTPAVHERVF